MSFNFGGSTPAPAPSTFSFGGAKSDAKTSAGGSSFSFGGSNSAAPANSFSFGSTPAAAPTATSAPASSFSFGSSDAKGGKSAAPASSVSFGNSTATTSVPAAPAPAFSFGGSTTPAPAPTTTDKSAAPASSFSFGGSAAPAFSKNTAPAPAVSFGGSATPAPAPAGTDKSAAPASSFSFGGSATPAPAPAATDKSAAPASSFSFGGSATPTPAATDKGAAPAPAFSFGGSATPAPAPAATDNKKGITAPALGATVLATKAAEPKIAFGSTGVSGTSSNSTSLNIPQPAEEYKTQTINQIINALTDQLEKDACEFTKEAERVAEWDAVLRDSQSSVSQLADFVSRVLAQQTDLDRTLASVESFQHELNESLNGVERNIDELFSSSTHLSPEDVDIERDRALQRAVDVEASLTKMSNDLQETIEELNVTHERALDTSSSNSLGQVVRTFNEHLTTLLWLETTSQKIESELETVGRGFQQIGM